jgi:hypothetical protein
VSRPAEATENDINRWQELIQQRPEGPWVMGNGGSFDRTEIRPISDQMMAELAEWLKIGYTPWNGRSMPLSKGDRQFMFMLYFSVQGLVSRVRQAEKEASSRAVGTSPWIPVAKTYPPPNIWILVAWGGDRVDKAHTFSTYKHPSCPAGYLIQGHPGAHVDVTHWMPMPTHPAANPETASHDAAKS